ncbi:WYL domain-containing protein [Evansella sp. AB-P1]|uniref:WYL domain-containing protein n=1 Tax=Evansella sp. AB-P1 TaxID=3037653 RepID=UPI00241E4526|nr:WYL domain-containing protein [Evansella sp. AB-P1]MDG5787161.1 WYL domain-containing protein [Evansella sp. AB-P1]
MNLFKKVHNYEFQRLLKGELSYTEYDNQRLKIETGPFLPTNDELKWLRYFLNKDEGTYFLGQTSHEKLIDLLKCKSWTDYESFIIQKGKPEEYYSWNNDHKQLRKLIINKCMMELSYETKDGEQHFCVRGLPYKLEFNVIKKEWYLLWIREIDQLQRITPLHQILKVSAIETDTIDLIQLEEQIIKSMTKKKQVKIEISPNYNQEIQRIFYAFSCFEKEITSKIDKEQNVEIFRIHLSYFEEEEAYVLSKIRFLGQHIKIVSPKSLQEKMYDTATKALNRYA